jgi:hypothetical protein
MVGRMRLANRTLGGQLVGVLWTSRAGQEWSLAVLEGPHSGSRDRARLPRYHLHTAGAVRRALMKDQGAVQRVSTSLFYTRLVHIRTYPVAHYFPPLCYNSANPNSARSGDASWPTM